MTSPERVVFDCNVFFQALTSPRGPARRLLSFVSNGDISLFVSAYSLDELCEVAARPHIIDKYGLEADVVADFVAEVRAVATCLDSIPHVFDFPRDPKDAHYVDLALAADAKLIVSRDKDLLSLRDDRHERRPGFHEPLPCPLDSHAARSAEAPRSNAPSQIILT